VPPLHRDGREIKRRLGALRVVGLVGQIAVGHVCPDPTKEIDNQPSEVVRIDIIGPNHYRVERADGSAFDLSNCGVVALFTIDPSETPLTAPEVKRLGNRMFSQSIGRDIPPEWKRDILALQARGKNANQMADVQAVIDRQREIHRRQKMREELEGERDLDGRTLSAAELDAAPPPDTAGVELGADEPPVPAASGLDSL